MGREAQLHSRPVCSAGLGLAGGDSAGGDAGPSSSSYLSTGGLQIQLCLPAAPSLAGEGGWFDRVVCVCGIDGCKREYGL